MRQVRSRMVVLIEMVDAKDHDRAAALLEQHPSVDQVAMEKGRIRVTLKANIEDYSDLASQLISAQFRLKHFGEEEINLESAFIAHQRHRR